MTSETPAVLLPGDLPGQTYIDSLLPSHALPPVAPPPVPKGLTCPACGGRKLYVTNVKRVARGSIRRYRECRGCAYKVVTIERQVNVRAGGTAAASNPP
jgi:hypothetical protein